MIAGPSRESSDEATVIDDKTDGVMLVLPNPRTRGSAFDSIEDDEDDEDQSGSVEPSEFWRPFQFERGFFDSGFSGLRGESRLCISVQIALLLPLRRSCKSDGYGGHIFTPRRTAGDGSAIEFRFCR